VAVQLPWKYISIDGAPVRKGQMHASTNADLAEEGGTN
jgi:hypothetical protein